MNSSAINNNNVDVRQEEAPGVIPFPDKARNAGRTLGQVGERAIDAASDIAQDAVDVSDDVRAAMSMVPRDGYDRRNDLIFSAEDLTTEQKLSESYRNDARYAADVEKAGNTVNRMRDNKSKNIKRVIGAGIAAVIIAVSFILGDPGNRAKIMKWIASDAE